jgi:hypothetical protein
VERNERVGEYRYKLLSHYSNRKEKKLFQTFSTFFYSHPHLLMLTPPAVDKLQYGPPQDESAINKLEQDGFSAISTTS